MTDPICPGPCIYRGTTTYSRARRSARAPK
jgi:hypothetical protein